ncbi:hypothetical protein [Brachybacterium sp. FME24]|uniref:hypothetical protein n=1 Tax=Brachybacterium sp. FME24 TaxID=2742605 RepID=UPI00186730E9|nr:hypothetical protein [Brachybacterium sp. FME24]
MGLTTAFVLLGFSFSGAQAGRRLSDVAGWEADDSAAGTRDDPEIARYVARAAATGPPAPDVLSLAAQMR